MTHIGQEFGLGDIGGIGLFRRRFQVLRLADPFSQEIADAVLPLPVAQGGTDSGLEIIDLHRPLYQRHVTNRFKLLQYGQRILPRRRQHDDRYIRPVLLSRQRRLKAVIPVGQHMFLGQYHHPHAGCHFSAQVADILAQTGLQTIPLKKLGGDGAITQGWRQDQDAPFRVNRTLIWHGDHSPPKRPASTRRQDHSW